VHHRAVAQCEPADSTPTSDDRVNNSVRQFDPHRALGVAFALESQHTTAQRMVVLAAEDMNDVDDALMFNNLDMLRTHEGISTTRRATSSSG
jgi:hypothetical protein